MLSSKSQTLKAKDIISFLTETVNVGKVSETDPNDVKIPKKHVKFFSVDITYPMLAITFDDDTRISIYRSRDPQSDSMSIKATNGNNVLMEGKFYGFLEITQTSNNLYIYVKDRTHTAINGW